MIINTNLNAMNAYRNMGSITGMQGIAMEKLSSGNRINRAADDAAGLAISEKMRSQIRGLNQASKNAQDGVSMIQTAEGALSETQAISQRMKELAVQSANGIYTKEDRKLINQEFGQLKKEIDRIAKSTEFNGSTLLSGEKSGKKFNSAEAGSNTAQIDLNKELKAILTHVDDKLLGKLGEGKFSIKFSVAKGGKDVKIELFDESEFNGNKKYLMDSTTIKDAQNGDVEVNLAGIKFKFVDLNKNLVQKNSQKVFGEIIFKNNLDTKEDGVKLQVGASGDQSIGFDIDFMRARELGLGGIEIGTVEDAKEAITRVDEAVKRVSSQRASLGATQNRLEHTIASNDNTAENLQAAESRVRDVDMAKEMMNLTKLNVLQQASQAMLSQANQAPNQVLSMLR